MRFLMLLAAGLYVANRMEKKLLSKKQSKQEALHLKELRDQQETLMDETLDESFPASDPPSFSPPNYHH